MNGRTRQSTRQLSCPGPGTTCYSGKYVPSRYGSGTEYARTVVQRSGMIVWETGTLGPWDGWGRAPSGWTVGFANVSL